MIDFADVVCGLAWGDEGKGKITAHLAKSGQYDYVCRWAGGSNAGHTIYVNNTKYKTHIVPAGVFYGINSVIGPGCVLHEESFYAELHTLQQWGFDTSVVKVSPRAHIVTNVHKSEDRGNFSKKLGTTSSGIGPAYSDKAKRKGVRAGEALPMRYLWDENFNNSNGKKPRILCEGAQGVWLDLDWGNYPYVTSSNTFPYAACSLGFPTSKIRNIWGAIKIYDTRSGTDPEFPETLNNDADLSRIQEIGNEFGVTTGRKRKVNWLDLDRLVRAINMTGTSDLVISKCDILEEAGVFKINRSALNFKESIQFDSMENMKCFLKDFLLENCPSLKKIYFSSSPYEI